MEGLSWQRFINHNRYAMGSAVHINNYARTWLLNPWQEVERKGILAMPSSHGIDLFLWAMGRRSSDSPKFLDSELQIADVPGIKIPDEECALFSARMPASQVVRCNSFNGQHLGIVNK